MRTLRYVILVLTATTFIAATTALVSAQPLKKTDAELETLRKKSIDNAVAFLRTQQLESGAFTANPRTGVGPTAVVLIGLLRCEVSPDDPMVKKALDFLLTFAKENGAIASPSEQLANYETCVVMMALSLANKGGVYDEVIKKADAFIRSQQFTEVNGISPDNPNYGGAGYNGRADMSSTHFLIEALRIASKGPDDPEIQKALVFVSRCQNLESEHNDSPKVPKNPDGGFYYSMEDGGRSYAGETDNGGLRSYGSMTYAGFKSILYAGLSKSDPRYLAAETWLKKNYSIDTNPGVGQRGLFYYYQLMAQTLAVATSARAETGMKTFTADNGVEHDWRAELIEILALRQLPNGSWVNPEPMWMEGDASLVTGYVLMALGECKR